MSPSNRFGRVAACWILVAVSLIFVPPGMSQIADQSTFSQARWSAPRRPLPVHDSHGGNGIQLVNADLEPDALPGQQGQVWREYDIRGVSPATAGAAAKPQRSGQQVVDWILRETGTDIWFGDPYGALSLQGNRLRVFHTPAIQDQVAEIVQRFTTLDAMKQAFGIRLVTMSSPTWRAKAVSRLTPVAVQSPGIEAWLASREDAAVILQQIRSRPDFREHSSPNLLIQNGQTHLIERRRPVAYVRGVRAAATAPSGYLMDMGQINEGYSLYVSPLLSKDRETADAVIRLETTQIEKLTNMSIPTPTVTAPRKKSQVQIPQTSSWRLHERFRWPSRQVLLISCGIIGNPGPDRGNLLGLPALAGRPSRKDALLFVEVKGRFNDLISGPAASTASPEMNYRGRY